MQRKLFKISVIIVSLILLGCNNTSSEIEPVRIAKNVSTKDLEDTVNVYSGTIDEEIFYISRKVCDKNYSIRTFKCPVGNDEVGISDYYSPEDRIPRVVDYETYKKTWDYYCLNWSDTSNDIRADIGWEYSDTESNYIIYVVIDNAYKFTSPNEPVINDYIRNDYMMDIYVQGEKELSKDNFGDGYILVIPTDFQPGQGRISIINTLTEKTWEHMVDEAKTNKDEKRRLFSSP